VNLAQALAEYLLKVSYDDLPHDALENAKKVIVSTLASAAQGSKIESARIVRELAREQGGVPEATAWFSDGLRLPLANAVRVNAMLSDAAASDDSDLRNIAHTGTIVTSVSLAAAEKTCASGRDVLAAIVAGYEASGRIGEAISPGLGERGFHACIITVFGGVIAASRLFGLSLEQTSHALCLAATSVGGLAISTNAWSREYHAGAMGLAAVNAVQAASRGFTGVADIFEARRGFLETFGANEGAVDSITRDLGASWDIVTDLAIKVWPGSHPLSAAVEAAVNAAREAKVDPDAVESIRVQGPRFRTLVGHRHPKDLAGAIHSLAYYLAAAVVDKHFTWQHVSMEKILDPTIDRLQDLVDIEPTMDPSVYTWGWGATVTIRLKDGTEHRATVNAPRGSGPRGIAWSDVELKLRTLGPESGKSAADIERLLSIAQRFDEEKDVAAFMALV
jgi:2-methylcitrate dehydratase PrpD